MSRLMEIDEGNIVGGHDNGSAIGVNFLRRSKFRQRSFVEIAGRFVGKEMGLTAMALAIEAR